MNDYDYGSLRRCSWNPALTFSSDISPGWDTRSSVQASVRRPVPASSPPVGVLKASGFLGSFPSHALNPRACVSPVYKGTMTSSSSCPNSDWLYGHVKLCWKRFITYLLRRKKIKASLYWTIDVYFATEQELDKLPPIHTFTETSFIIFLWLLKAKTTSYSLG